MQDLFLLRQDEIIKSVRLQQNKSEMLWSKYFLFYSISVSEQ